MQLTLLNQVWIYAELINKWMIINCEASSLVWSFNLDCVMHTWPRLWKCICMYVKTFPLTFCLMPFILWIHRMRLHFTQPPQGRSPPGLKARTKSPTTPTWREGTTERTQSSKQFVSASNVWEEMLRGGHKVFLQLKARSGEISQSKRHDSRKPLTSGRAFVTELQRKPVFGPLWLMLSIFIYILWLRHQTALMAEKPMSHKKENVCMKHSALKFKVDQLKLINWSERPEHIEPEW